MSDLMGTAISRISTTFIRALRFPATHPDSELARDQERQGSSTFPLPAWEDSQKAFCRPEPYLNAILQSIRSSGRQKGAYLKKDMHLPLQLEDGHMMQVSRA